ncbi:MAG: hypothetical protein HOQ02_01200 [Lysobacter sp.]|nr:hypothetical protein [Lysobacter sp.]
MNPRLQLKLLRGAGTPTPAAPAPEPPPLRLLGDGLDAIIQCTRRAPVGWECLFWPRGFNDSALPIAPTVMERQLRYLTAAQLHPLHSDPAAADMREALGGLYRAAWARREFPNFRRFSRLMPVPLVRRRVPRAALV